MEVIIILINIGIFFSVGFSILKLLRLNSPENLLLDIALSFGIGIGVVSTFMLFLDSINIKWNFFSLTFPLIVLSLVSLPFLRYKITKKKKGKDILEKILLLLILLVLSSALMQALIRPVTAWDAIASWFLGGKSFFVEKEIIPSYFIYADYDYPPIMHMALAFVNLNLKAFNDTYSKLFYFLFYPALLIIFYFMLREDYSKKASLFFTFLIASTQNMFRHGGRYDIGNADLPLAYFFLLAAFFYIMYKRTLKKGYLILGFLTLSTLSLIKNDGIPFAIACFILFGTLCFKNKKMKELLLLPLFAIPFFYWKLYVYINHLPGTYLNFFYPTIQRIPVIFYSYLKEFINIQRWNLGWIFIIPLLFVAFKKIKHQELLFLIIVQLLFITYVYVVTPLPVTSHISNSFDRLLLQIFPICMYIALQAFLTLFNGVKKGKIKG